MREILGVLLVFSLCVGVAVAQGDPAPTPWLGVTLGAVPDDVPDDERGVLITGVVRESPADGAGLRGSDVVTHVGGRRVLATGDLIAAVRALEIGGWVEFRILRRGRERTLTARLEARPDRRRLSNIKQAWAGVYPVDVPLQLREFWGGSEDAGVLIGATYADSPAEAGGLLPGDLVLAVDGREVAGARELIVLLRRSGVENTIELEISRQGALLELEIDLREPPPPEPAEEDQPDDS